MSFLKAALGYVATAYMNDAVVKPRSAGKLARNHCNRVGKPLLLIHGQRVVDALVGPPVKADVTQNTAYPIRVPNKTYGAIVAVNALECLKRPDLAIQEWRRVADKIFVVVPSWWSPYAWLDPSKRWLVHPDLKRVAPLWTSHLSIYLLPVSDSRYGRPRWSQKKTTSPRRPSPPVQKQHPPMGLPQSQMSQLSEEMEPPPTLYEEALPVMKDLPDLEEAISSESRMSDLGIAPSFSRSSPSVLTVVSTQSSDGG